MAHKYTQEEIEFLKVHYPIGDWDAIFTKIPGATKSAIHSQASKLGIKFDVRFKKTLSKEDCKTRTKWSEEEIQILLENYPTRPMDEVLNLLPNRSINSIRLKANKYNLISWHQSQERYTDAQRQFIKDNWILIPDPIMASILGKNRHSIQDQRLKMGLYRKDMNSLSYPSLAKFLRGQNWRWKKESMEACNYSCVLTKTKNFEIHHLYGVSNIIEDILRLYPEYRRERFEEYTPEDLSFILQQFLQIQKQYPLGECVDKKLHVLFHSMYGQYYNTPEQWYRFKEDYKKGIYNDYL